MHINLTNPYVSIPIPKIIWIGHTYVYHSFKDHLLYKDITCTRLYSLDNMTIDDYTKYIRQLVK